MSVQEIKYKKGASVLDKKRCAKKSKHKYEFSKSAHMENGSQCSRSAVYIVDGAELCKIHAGEMLLNKELSK